MKFNQSILTVHYLITKIQDLQHQIPVKQEITADVGTETTDMK